MASRHGAIFPTVAALAGLVAAGAAWQAAKVRMGRQPDGTFVVSSGRRIEPGTIAFDGRPVDIAVHPSGGFAAVVGQNRVLLVDEKGVVPGGEMPLGAGAAFHGIVWHPDGDRFFASTANGTVVEGLLGAGRSLHPGRRFEPKPDGAKGNPRPGGMAITKDGTRLFVVAMDRDTVAEFDLVGGRLVYEYPTHRFPFTVALSSDEKTLVVSNWGGRPPKDGDDPEEIESSNGVLMVIDPKGGASTGTVALIPRSGKPAAHIPVGIHPTALCVDGDRVWVANSGSDTISEISVSSARVTRTTPLRWGRLSLYGAVPSALALNGSELLVACGGDNAVAVVDPEGGKVLGYRPAGYFPIAIGVAGSKAYVVNTKGNGSVRETEKGKPGNAHDFQGTVSVVDLAADLVPATARVAELNGWNRDRRELDPVHPVYSGAIEHVVYIIKENRTYDEVFGDMPQGNGDKALCGLGETVTPNHHKLAREFALFDNGYVSGTNSADGHNWTDGALANDYLERFYTGYRTYPDDGDDPMGRNPSGYIWDAARRKGRTVRIYGEFADDARNKVIPEPKDWLEVFRARGTRKFRFETVPSIRANKALYHPEYLYWPLLQSDQHKADLFIDEYRTMSRERRVPNLMVLSLPADHTEGLSDQYPKPRSMVADNDLALGRIVDAVSHSPEWARTAIVVVEDDAQAGPDHVDGHRSVLMVFSPWMRRGVVDSTMITTVTLLRTIEKMLGLDPMNRMDALTPPLLSCFADKPDNRPYDHVPNRIPLDDMNVPRSALSPSERVWYDRSAALDWSGMDRADFHELNLVLWHHLHPGTPWPMRPSATLAEND
ncbi:MAG: bifunctional YncE family protein/alkaline phosphatase family protein [Armatimonadota bacterium]